ncbi:unnamed protein product, partial [Rotaria sp. Silwood1]
MDRWTFPRKRMKYFAPPRT